MDTTKKESKWELFKKGTTEPLTLSMASLCFTFFVGLGAAVAGIKFFMDGSWGLGIMFVAIACLQVIGVIREWKQFHFLKNQDKNIKENAEKFKDLFSKMKDVEKVN